MATDTGHNGVKGGLGSNGQERAITGTAIRSRGGGAHGTTSAERASRAHSAPDVRRAKSQRGLKFPVGAAGLPKAPGHYAPSRGKLALPMAKGLMLSPRLTWDTVSPGAPMR